MVKDIWEGGGALNLDSYPDEFDLNEAIDRILYFYGALSERVDTHCQEAGLEELAMKVRYSNECMVRSTTYFRAFLDIVEDWPSAALIVLRSSVEATNAIGFDWSNLEPDDPLQSFCDKCGRQKWIGVGHADHFWNHIMPTMEEWEYHQNFPLEKGAFTKMWDLLHSFVHTYPGPKGANLLEDAVYDSSEESVSLAKSLAECIRFRCAVAAIINWRRVWLSRPEFTGLDNLRSDIIDIWLPMLLAHKEKYPDAWPDWAWGLIADVEFTV